MGNQLDDANDLRRVTMYLPEVQLKVLRVKAAEEGISVSEYMRRLLAVDLGLKYKASEEERTAGRPRGSIEISED